MAASVADPDSFGHREMTALLNWQKFHIDKTAATAVRHRLPITAPGSQVTKSLRLEPFHTLLYGDDIKSPVLYDHFNSEFYHIF